MKSQVSRINRSQKIHFQCLEIGFGDTISRNIQILSIVNSSIRSNYDELISRHVLPKSTRPNFSLTILKNLTFSSHLETSALTNMALSSPNLETSSSPCVVFMSTIASFHPFCARSSANARPMPTLISFYSKDIRFGKT